MSTNDYYNMPDTLRELQETINNSKAYMELEKIQRHIDEIYPPALRELSEKIQPYLNEYAATAAKLQEEIASFSPVFDELKRYEDFYDNAFASIAQNQAAMALMADIDSYAIRDIFSSFKESEKISQEINIDTASALYAEGKITDEDIAEEVGEMVSKRDFSLSNVGNTIKRAVRFLASRFLIHTLVLILTLSFSPLDERMKNNYLEKLNVNEFWEESGAYEIVDKIFGIKSGAVSEQEAKDTVLEENVGNISKKKREDLLQKIQAIRDYISAAPQDENTGNLLAYLSELEKDVNGKKYGLVFEEHREEIDEVLDAHTPVLTEEKEMFIDNGGQMNFLIEGDNLAALKLLEKTHRGRIQMIYIDPPYNTGNKDFTYDDNKVDSLDGFRHSKWLSFMSTRLKIAKGLLSLQGVLFISIDDNEMSTLKSLCDNIFGENNFVATVVIKSNPRGSQSTKEIASVHEYVLVYAKDILSSAIIGHKLTENMQSEYNLSDENGAYRLLGLRQRGGFWRASERPNLYYPFFVNPDTANISLVEDEEHTIAVLPYQPSTGEKGTWRWSREKVAVDGKYLIAKTVKRGENIVWDIYQKDYMTSDDTVRRTKAKSLWDEKDMNYQNAANELKDLFGISPFTYAKPTYLIRRAMEMIDFSDNPFVLDFFAGSGTTGHAVMKLNAEDGGNRRFILCTNNENNICRDVTYERIKRVIDKESYAASLKYYRIDYVPIDERMYYEYADELLKHIRELVELENGVNFIGNAEIGIVLTEEELEAFVSNADAFSKCKKLYMGHDLLPTQDQEKALEERGIEISIIPDYYYRDLQER